MQVVYKEMAFGGANSSVAILNLIGRMQFKDVKNFLFM